MNAPKPARIHGRGSAGEVMLKVPKLRTLPFETAIIERNRQREGSKEDKASWTAFSRHLKERPEALWQRCAVHFYRNVWTEVPTSKVKDVAAMRKSDSRAGRSRSYKAEGGLQTNNPLKRLLREMRRRTRAVGAFSDGKSALMLAAARLRHVVGTKWGTRPYLDMNRLAEAREAA